MLLTSRNVPSDAASGAVAAAGLDAVCAVGRAAAGPGGVSLSPASIMAADPVPRLVLPSPDGSAICAALADRDVEVAVGSLRHARAVGRWLDGRPGRDASPEAEGARTASTGVHGDALRALMRCASGSELVANGFAGGVVVGTTADVPTVVPVLTDGWFVGQGACGSTRPLS